jgi:hypothetical protein
MAADLFGGNLFGSAPAGGDLFGGAGNLFGGAGGDLFGGGGGDLFGGSGSGYGLPAPAARLPNVWPDESTLGEKYKCVRGLM